MAGWLTALRLVPWGEVVKNAPQIAEGARKLWQTVGRSKAGKAAPGSTAMTTTEAGTDPAAALAQRVTALERELAEATALIHALAEQDKQLVGQVAQLQQRSRWIARALVVVSGVLVVVVVWQALSR